MDAPFSGSLLGRVLVVDDDRGFSALVEQTLAEVGLNTAWARSGEEALRLCEVGQPRAVILDGLLPGIRGEEVARRLRRTFSPQDLPIVFVSAFFRDPGSYQVLSAAGVNAILHKPLDPDGLKRALRLLLGLSGLPDDDEDDEGIPGAEMAQLLAEYLADTRERTRSLLESVAGLAGPSASDVRSLLRTEAHRLRGSGASFGIPEISRLAGDIEDLLTLHEDAAALPVQAQARLAGLARALHEKVCVAAGTSPLPARRAPDMPPRVLLLDDADTELSTSFSVVSAASDAVKAFSTPDALLESAVAMRPDAVVVASDGKLDGLAAVRRLREAGIGPILLISASSEPADRLRAVRAGAEGYLPRPADAAATLALVEAYVRPPAGTRILAVDDDRLFLAVIAEALAPHAIAVEPCTDPAQVFDAVDRSPPELLVVDIELPGMNGIELTRMLRADPLTRRLPVLILSSHDSVEARTEAFAAGADDFVSKPFEPDEVAARIMAHLRRKLVFDRDPGRDPTGVPGRRWLSEACDRALALARRGGRTLALLAVDVGFPALQSRSGPIAAEAVVGALTAQLSGAFRKSDLVARIGTGRVAALLHDVTVPDAQRLLRSELAAFGTRTFSGPAGTFQPVLRGQVVTFPETGADASALLAALDAGLDAQQGQGLS